MLAGSILSGLKQVSAIENRPAADRTRSRDFLPRSTFEARLEGTPTQSLNMKSAGSVRSRPQCHCRDPRDCRGHHGGFCSTRTRRGVSTSPCGVGTPPTAASGATPGRQWSSATSSGGAQRLCILRTYPYPVYGTAGPVGGGPICFNFTTANPIHVEREQCGKGVKHIVLHRLQAVSPKSQASARGA